MTDVELWEAEDRAYFHAREADGTLLRELSAGPGYLREHDHVAQHQVLRTSFDLARGLSIVRSAFGGGTEREHLPVETTITVDEVSLTTTNEGLPARMTADGVAVDWDYRQTQSLQTEGPSITRRRGYSWEVYQYRGLAHFSRTVLLAPWLPMNLGGAWFVEGFLYASAWYPTIEAHLFWRRDDMQELELVVTETDLHAELSSLSTVRSATGPARMVDLRGPDVASVDTAASVLRLADIAAVDAPMGRVEVVGGNHRLIPASAT